VLADRQRSYLQYRVTDRNIVEIGLRCVIDL